MKRVFSQPMRMSPSRCGYGMRTCSAIFAATVAALGAVLLGLSEVKLPVLCFATLVVLVGLLVALRSVWVELPVPIANDPDKDMYRRKEERAEPEFSQVVLDCFADD